MRNRKFYGAFVIAAMMSAMLVTTMPVSADEGGPGGPQRSTCAFLAGLLMKKNNPDKKSAIWARVFEAFGCDFDDISD